MQSSRVASLLAILMAGLGGSAHGGVPPGPRAAPLPVAPAADAVVYEGGLTLAWTPPQRAGRHVLLLSGAPFDATGWTSLPASGAVEAHEVASPVVSLDALGVTVGLDAPLYWAAAHLDPEAGHWSFSETRGLRVIPRFSNAVQPAPELAISPLLAAATPERAGPDRIRLAAGYTIDPAAGEPAVPFALRASALRGGERQTLLVHFGTDDPDAVRARILSNGGAVVAYLPDHTFLVRLAGGAATESAAFETVIGAAWVGAFQPAYKLSSRLALEGDARQHATVLLFADGDLANVSAVATAGGRIERTSNNGINKILRVEASPAVLLALAREPDVAWIEPYVTPVVNNDLDQWVVQTGISGDRRVWDMGIHGEGQIVMTSDSGINMSHNQFRDPAVFVGGFGNYPTHRKVIAYQLGSDDPGVAFLDHGSFHGTHTAGTIAGNDDPVSTSARDGMAKGARIYFMDISGSALGTSVVPFADLNDLFLPPYVGNAAGGARISSNSWGSSVNGAYTVDSYTADQFMWNHPDFLICFSNGNSGPTVNTVGSPASSKNTIGVGGTGNGTSQNTIYTSTSRGPTPDQRRKPTIAAPGNGVTSSTTGGTGYATFAGTSMASPSLAGAATLMRQYLTEGWYPTGAKVPANGFAPSAALLKAMVINAGVNSVTGFSAPDNNIGYGRVTADEVLYFAGDLKRLLLSDFTAGLGHQQAIEYQVNVVDTSVPLEVSLCWTDFPGSPLASIQLVNNLDLTVTNGVSTYRGNVYVAGVSVTGGSYDDRNVEEAVLVAVPTTGVWTIRIDGTNVPAGPQPFGLCITGGVGTTAGAIAVDRAVYGSASTMMLRVVDTNAAATVDVTVTSDTEPGGEPVTLAGSGGLYTGTLTLSPYGGSSGDGTLQVSHGDQLVATYLDASPSASLAAGATVSFNPAVITDVVARDEGSASVLVSWTTDVNATSTVEYGTTTALGNSASDALAVLSHQLSVAGLAYGQTYYFDVVSEDLNGNLTRDDNGGLHYRFTGGQQGELLLVYGGPSFEREARYTNALNHLGWTYDVWRGAASDSPRLGNLASGLRAYKVVWWQPSFELYPAFSDVARDSITAYLDGGGRLVVTGHDIAWGLADPSSPAYSAARATWLQNTLHTQFQTDPPTWGSITGIAADPISGAYTGGIAYAEPRFGASGDNINSLPGTGTASYVWRSPTPDDCAIRWESGAPVGNPADALWGGTKTRLAGMYFEWSAMVPTLDDSPIRDAVMSNTLEWLMGRARPSVAVATPNGGEVLTGDNVSIAWTESAGGGLGIGARTIDYSPDGGQSWEVITTSPGASPYLWDLTGVPNTGNALVRIRIDDDGTPALSRADVTDATFAIQRAGADAIGPTVVPGSIVSSPNPIHNQSPASLVATITDAHSGGGLVDAAEWSFGDTPAPAGSGAAMSGAFPASTVDVSATLTTGNFNSGARKLWVRGHDTAGNWGSAQALGVAVNGPPVSVAGIAPRRYALMAPAPNPAYGATRIEFALPVEGPVDVSVFDVQGRKVRTLIAGVAAAGVHTVRWDRVDATGRTVGPGVYFVRYRAGGHSFERRIVALN